MTFEQIECLAIDDFKATKARAQEHILNLKRQEQEQWTTQDKLISR